MKSIFSLPGRAALAIGFFAVFVSAGRFLGAENQAENARVRVLGATLKEEARPLTDPNAIKESKPKADPFFDKLRRERDRFFKKRQEKQRSFLERIKKKHPEPAELEKALAKFHGDDTENTQKFLRKQKEKVDRYLEKKEKNQ
jgi:hypothetical protein